MNALWEGFFKAPMRFVRNETERGNVFFLTSNHRGDCIA